MSASKLFAPARIGALALSNSVAMAPMTRSRADVFGVPTAIMADYYGQRASAGLLITEGTQTSFEGQGYARTPGMHTDAQVAGWRKVTDAVHSKGGKIFVQLMHCGRIAHPLNRQVAVPPVAPSAVAPAGKMWTDQSQMQDMPVPRALSTAEVKAAVEEHAASAKRAIEAGASARAAASGGGREPTPSPS